MTKKDWRAQEYPFPETKAAAEKFFQQESDAALLLYVPASSSLQQASPCQPTAGYWIL